MSSEERDALAAVISQAAKHTAQSRDLAIASDAIDLLVSAALKNLDPVVGIESAMARRAEIEQNTARLVRFVMDSRAEPVTQLTVTLRAIEDALAAFCRQFPNFYPFCPHP